MHPDPLIIFAALLLDFALGDPRSLPHPVVAIGRLVLYLDKNLRRSWLNERVAGVLLLILVLFVTIGITWFFIYFLAIFSIYAGCIAAVFVSYTCLAARSLHKESALVVSTLRSGDIEQARIYLSYIVGRDTQKLTETEIWRAVVETVAENTSDGIIAPLFWLSIGGPVSGMAFKAVSTLDSMVGYKNDRYINMGWASARMDDLLNFIPARLTALLLILASPLAGVSTSGAFRITLRDRFNHSSPNSGHPEAAAAGALGVRLGGDTTYGGTISFKKYLGDDLRPLDESAYQSMIKLMYISTILMTLICVFATFVLRGFCVPFL
ncbi:MAG: adenosylcobinamide-phosphate synthase CbiB [Desulfuromonadaceae bacterium]|nr:adenosylcobinamide-phosphate synthase CbiB [Desulfuromonadaceae bacterium]MDD2856200.1 adenosylcobinamide-phosphate synthase CbiB [Desulfuromonadaceae bacterium]